MLFFLLTLVMVGLLVGDYAYAFDAAGLRPTQPNAVFSTFSTATNPPGIFANEMCLEYAVDPTFYRITSSVTYGIDSWSELLATVPFRIQSEEYGFEDVSVGLKHRFKDEGDILPSMALLMSVSPPSGLNDITTRGRYGGGLITSKKIGPFMVHANAFYFSPFGKSLKGEWNVLLGTDMPAANNVNFLTEVYIKKSHFANNIDFVEGRLGYRYKPLKYLYTTLGTGYEFKSRQPNIRVFLSFTFVYPYKEPQIKKIYEEE
ncbi:MAG: hypothetical protein SFH39_11030 [Candidatus Magnetobacterium sp. LHC-1]|uniref:Transporter n=1 Tax=Candidatus Magnetobacterium casense TaxID=1455061 RepID=A0ABS6S1R6_9BACT|nr:hypothetical protein [Candidatus Magnetobacterium casensis]MBV6342354.1 hypothetical protein [Candidatus Magnetobacterium casensis]